MSYAPKRSSIVSSSSVAPKVNARRLSSITLSLGPTTSSNGSVPTGTNGRPSFQPSHVLAGTGALPSIHTAALKSNSLKAGPFPSHQHRTRSLQARLARAFPNLFHNLSSSMPRRRRRISTAFLIVCAGGVLLLICTALLSPRSWSVSISRPNIDPRSIASSAPQALRRLSGRSGSNNKNGPESNLPKATGITVFQLSTKKDPSQTTTTTVYKNRDGTDMDAKTAFLKARDFGAKQCQQAFAPFQKSASRSAASSILQQERDRLQRETWPTIALRDRWDLALSWKRNLKRILPNWKEFSPGWVGQGVVLTAFRDGEGRRTIDNILVQIKLIRSLSSMPIEVWFEQSEDQDGLTGELEELLASWGAVTRFLDQERSMVPDAPIDEDTPAPEISLESPIHPSEIEYFRERSKDLAQRQKALTIAALINSGFEDIVYFSPSTLPMQSPRLILQQPEYTQTGALFWQHPTLTPAHDSPMWAIIQQDCIPTTFEQSWSAFALRHKDAWKSLFLAWHWLTGSRFETYDQILGRDGNDMMRLAYIAVGRPYAMVDRFPQAGLLDMSASKGEGIGCSVGAASVYAAPNTNALIDPVAFRRNQQSQHRLFQKKQRKSSDEGEFFIENQDVMMINLSPESSLVRSGSIGRELHSAIDQALSPRKDASRMLLTDSYLGGSDGRICLRVTRKLRGYY
ncbi:hypothetical protein BGW38_007140 [Lunasporangiospora selenospora]|uniref:Uncharacterized protein n=1 Tax=Lunasporangiospora selenospora TaxID=979761 RepID=A0A9P6FZU5_9FUNG|nr:hypothetical protein BGW38_007140 [Lunasporangiospora selenospora]